MMTLRSVALGLCLMLGLPLVAAQSSPPQFRSLYSFSNNSTASAYPVAALAVDGHGALFGTTYYGGTFGFGTVFSVTPPSSPGGAWTEATIWSFGGAGDGQLPYAAVVIGTGGLLYGVTERGGASGNGTVFSLAPPSSPGGAWTEHLVYSFTGGADGGDPAGPLVISSGGVLYDGTAGNVFSLTPPDAGHSDWIETVLYTFSALDGPAGGVSIGSDGVLYGTTVGRGDTGGTVFSLTPPDAPGGSSVEAVLHTFSPSPRRNQAKLQCGVVIGSGGVLYGTTFSGGAGNKGSVFSLTPPATADGSWTLATLYDFGKHRGAAVGVFLGGLRSQRKPGRSTARPGVEPTPVSAP